MERSFSAVHSLPLVGATEPHRHTYSVRAGYLREISPQTGCTKAIQDASAALDAVIAKLTDENLNEVLPVPPTAEMLACWVLAQLVRPGGHHRIAENWDFVEVRCYGDSIFRIERSMITHEWISKLAGLT